LDASELLIKSLTLRRDYCRPAAHSFPSTTARFLQTNERNGIADVETVHEEKKTVEGKFRFYVEVKQKHCRWKLTNKKFENFLYQPCAPERMV
jgi:hypothetical protein